MATISAIEPSGATDGKIIVAGSTAFANRVEVHTAAVSSTIFDEVYITATNLDAGDLVLTLTVEATGGELEDDSLKIPVTIAGGATERVLAGHRIKNGSIISAYTTVANKINLLADVNRIDET